MLLEFSSKIIEQAVDAFSQLPGVGKKTALRYVLHVIKQDADAAIQLSTLIAKLKTDLQFCDQCHNITEQVTCEICSNESRDKNYHLRGARLPGYFGHRKYWPF